MADVDPRLQQIPKQLLADFDLRVYFEELERFLHDLWVRTGAGDDAISNQSTRELYSWQLDSKEESKVEYNVFNDKSTHVVTTGSNYTTTGLESLLIVTGAITITLNAKPQDQEKVSIKRATTAGFVVVSGQIDGASSYTMTQNYQCIDLIYSVSAGEWLII